MNIQAIVIVLLIGGIAGWLAGKIIKGGGFGIVGNIIVGIVGSVVGNFVFAALGLFAHGILGSIITATCGAIILLFIVRLIKRM